jgi:hypothetical protein
VASGKARRLYDTDSEVEGKSIFYAEEKWFEWFQKQKVQHSD